MWTNSATAAHHNTAYDTDILWTNYPQCFTVSRCELSHSTTGTTKCGLHWKPLVMKSWVSGYKNLINVPEIVIEVSVLI